MSAGFADAPRGSQIPMRTRCFWSQGNPVVACKNSDVFPQAHVLHPKQNKNKYISQDPLGNIQ